MTVIARGELSNITQGNEEKTWGEVDSPAEKERRGEECREDDLEDCPARHQQSQVGEVQSKYWQRTRVLISPPTVGHINEAQVERVDEDIYHRAGL